MGFYGLDAHQYYTTLVNAFKQLFKSGSEVLLFFRSIVQQCSRLILNSSAHLTSPYICARCVSLLLIWKETLGEQIQFALLLPHQSQIQNELFLRHSQKQSCHFALKYS